jgi:hypothetical protein
MDDSHILLFVFLLYMFIVTYYLIQENEGFDAFMDSRVNNNLPRLGSSNAFDAFDYEHGPIYSFGTTLEKSDFPLKAIKEGDADLPRAFNQWQENGHIRPPRNQGKCGSCWAFAITSMMADRFNIATCGAFDSDISVQNFLDCDGIPGGCKGITSITDALKELAHGGKIGGLVRTGAYPYESQEEREDGPCKIEKIGKEEPRFDVLEESIVNLCESDNLKKLKPDELKRNIIRMKREIYNNGPIISAMLVWSDLFSYKEGVYEHKEGDGEPTGGHAILIIGWGYDEKGEYWICKNSWGPSWGLKGFWHHRMGDACLLESNAHSALPDMTHPYMKNLQKGCKHAFGHLHDFKEDHKVHDY